MHKFLGTCLLLICAPLSAAERAESFSATVELFSDGADRVWASIDRDNDEIVDGLIGLTVEAKYPSEVLAVLPWRFDSAIVTLADRRVNIVDTVSGDRVTLGLDDTDGRSSSLRYDSGRAVLALLDGAALTRHTFDPQRAVAGDEPGESARFGFADASAWTQSLSTLGRRGSDRAQSNKECQAGGDGSSGCSAGCGLDYEAQLGAATVGGGAGFGASSSCSTNCTAGYHACCNCQWSVYWVGSVPVVYQRAGCECVYDGGS